MPNYERPPIIESIIEVRFARPLDQKALAKYAKAKKEEFPNKIDSFAYGVMVTPKGVSQTQVSNNGYRLESVFSSQKLIIFPDKFIYSVSAPYPGWQKFYNEFVRHWEEYRELDTKAEISWVSMAYINRIDLEVENNQANINDFLNIGVSTPEGLELEGYEASMGIKVDHNISGAIRTNTGQSPHPNRAALFLVIDLFCQTEVPQESQHIYKLLEKFRDKKNEYFEQFITPNTRSLFGKVMS